MHTKKIVERWSRKKRGEFTAVRHFPEFEGTFCPLPPDLDARLVRALAVRGIDRLYCHQAEAWQLARAGRDFVVVTPTASGKTLCYNLPLCQAVAEHPENTALYLFPTKALSQDQMHELRELSGAAGIGLRAHTYDGDTPADLRRKIREQAHVVITNPDMLHGAILPHHPRWVRFLRSLKLLVIDELHSYRGVFGSHVANVLRRLQRVCAFYGSRPQIICCSATLANPGELASRLAGREMDLIDRSGAPRGAKTFLFYNPPLIDAELGIRASCIQETRRFVEDSVCHREATIVFAGSRLQVEILVRYLKNRFERRPGAAVRIRGYRGGYLPKMRRRIEEELRAGQVDAVVSTNALELGVDIGSLDICVLAGYPGTVASAWQQAGRAGRRQGHSLALLIARNLPLDQLLINNPEYFFGRSPEMGLIHPDNLHILLQHVQCAAFELPFQEGERFGEENLEEILAHLEEMEFVHRSGVAWYWSQEGYPADAVSLRNIPSENFVVLDAEQGNRVIAEVDYDSAPTLIHQDAIYMHQGRQYHVGALDWKGRRAYVHPVKVDYYTEAISYSGIRILDLFRHGLEAGCQVAQGEVVVSTHYPGYKKIRFYTMENVGYGKIHLPHRQMHTTASWFSAIPEVAGRAGLSRTALLEATLGWAWALHAVSCLTLMCDHGDIGHAVGDAATGWFAWGGRQGIGFFDETGRASYGGAPPETFSPAVFLYDNYTGGIGCSERLYDLFVEVLERTCMLLKNCRCAGGCPSCVGPVAWQVPDCKGNALSLAEVMLSSAIASSSTAAGRTLAG
ncbi:MAG: DEAD/DEAH box helicase [Acidobacteria bacterium]|nr:DEAD/DEAH box helicase [Acidobacteriota bacterium]